MFNDDRRSELVGRIINNNDGSYNARIFTKDGLQLLNIHQAPGAAEILDSDDNPVSGGTSDSDVGKTLCVYDFIDQKQEQLAVDMLCYRTFDSTTAANRFYFMIGYDMNKYLKDHEKRDVFYKYFGEYENKELDSNEASRIFSELEEVLYKDLVKYILFIKRIGNVEFQLAQTGSNNPRNLYYLYDTIQLIIDETGISKIKGTIFTFEKWSNAIGGIAYNIEVDESLSSSRINILYEYSRTIVNDIYTSDWQRYIQSEFNITITGEESEK